MSLLKCSFSFDVSSANRKKAEAHKTGGGPAPPPLTNAEEMALSLNTGRPVAEGIPAGCSSESVTPQDTSAYIKYSDGNICLLEPPVLTEPQAVDVGDDDTISADTERPIELPVKELYRLHLLKQIEKNNKEMIYLDRQILKSDMKIEILKHKLQDTKPEDVHTKGMKMSILTITGR
ncbi:myb SANT-like DNA-binding domain-containing 4-like isoform X1 [Labeo rohita]|uniref:Myb SANT-like DNA-binding domain-containing 4-like isoform X1 n=1 Tax=Labeo rohita TaxID=84645 RepID=A0A498N1Z4_LABRO|nr:myb SANT-like DNA-binding domain-containing 4-like isoform X1 [Labeo rohita]